MQCIKFRIEGAPTAKGRPRFARIGAHVRAYTPKKTEGAENTIKLIASNALASPFNGAVEIFIVFGMPIPKSTSKKRSEGLKSSPHLKRPDVDNLVKLVLDALNGVAWDDDSQVFSIVARKVYSDDPYTEITVCGHE